MRLKNKVAIITGAGTGIGYGLALGLAKEGAKIVAHYCNSKKGAEEVVEKIKKTGREAVAIRADVSKTDSVDRLIKKTIKTFGKIDVLINNAGIALWKPFFEITEEIWDKTIDTNLKGTFICSQRAAMEMVKTGGGKIINITSTGGYAGLQYLSAYCASKGGITLLTKEMAMELAPYKINVNAIGPGAIEVKRNLRNDPNYNETHSKIIPVGKVGKPSDLVGAAVFLSGKESDYITGQVLYVDGGILACVPQPEHDDNIKKRRKKNNESSC